MAIQKNAINPILTGQVGAFTYYNSKGQTVVRQAKNNSNVGESASRTQAQQNQRVKLANVVNFYKVSKKWMPKAFEGLRPGQTDYSRFLAANMPITKIVLTKAQAAAGACVVDNYIVSVGSLPSIAVTMSGANAYATNIVLGNLEISDTTTVAEFSQAVIANNSTIEYGMQLSFVSYMQDIDAQGIPRVICTPYELTLDASNTNPVRDYLPAFCSQSIVIPSSPMQLGTSNKIATGGFAYIISDKRSGKLLVSSQILVVVNQDLITEYTSGTQNEAATRSYGVNGEVFLSPDTRGETPATPKPVYIQSMVQSGNTYNANQEYGSIQKLKQSPTAINFSTTVDSAKVLSANATGANSAKLTGAAATATGKQLNFTWTGTSTSTENLRRIDIEIDGVGVISIPFGVPTGGGGDDGGTVE